MISPLAGSLTFLDSMPTEGMDTWLNHRTFLDWKLLLDEFLIFDWVVVAAYGFLVGFCIALGYWHVSKKSLDRLREEGDALRDKLELIKSLQEENAELQARLEEPDEVEEPNAITEDEDGDTLEETDLITVEPSETDASVSPGEKASSSKVVLHGPTPFQADDGVVFVLDVSLSMKRFIKYFKFTLQQGVEALLRLEQSAPPRYQVIFFSGPAWFAHQEIHSPEKEGDPYVVEDPEVEGLRTKWNRVQNRLNTFKSEDGIENLPKGEWREATPDDIEKTIQRIENVQLHPGTTWHRPLMLAMSLDPPPKRIDFLTDGRVANQMQVAEGIINMVNRSGGKTLIDTFGPWEASEGLRYIAEQTGGEYTEFGSGPSSREKQEDQDLLPGMEIFES